MFDKLYGCLKFKDSYFQITLPTLSFKKSSKSDVHTRISRVLNCVLRFSSHDLTLRKKKTYTNEADRINIVLSLCNYLGGVAKLHKYCMISDIHAIRHATDMPFCWYTTYIC